MCSGSMSFIAAGTPGIVVPAGFCACNTIARQTHAGSTANSSFFMIAPSDLSADKRRPALRETPMYQRSSAFICGRFVPLFPLPAESVQRTSTASEFGHSFIGAKNRKRLGPIVLRGGIGDSLDVGARPADTRHPDA